MANISEDVISQLNNAWAIGAKEQLSFLSGGCLETSLFRVQSDKGFFVVRVYPTQSLFYPIRKVWESKFLDYLSEREVPVIKYHKTIDGKLFTEFSPVEQPDSKYIMTVIGFISGVHLEDNVRAEWQVDIISQLIANMRRYHVPFILAIGDEQYYELRKEAQLFSRIKPDEMKQMTLTMDMVNQYNLPADEAEQVFEKFNSILAAFKDIEYEDWRSGTLLPTGFIHQDIHDGNVLFCPHGERKLVGVLDWEDFAIGPFIIDLALVIIAWSYVDGKWDISLSRRIVEVYQEMCPLMEVEKHQLWNYCILSVMYYYSMHIELFDSFEKTAKFIPESIHAYHQLYSYGSAHFHDLLFN